MKKIIGCLAILAILISVNMNTQAQSAPDKGPKNNWWKAFPRSIEEQLQLSEDQTEQILELENGVQARLKKILTPPQLKLFQELRSKGPKGGETGKKEERKKEDRQPPGSKDKY